MEIYIHTCTSLELAGGEKKGVKRVELQNLTFKSANVRRTATRIPDNFVNRTRVQRLGIGSMEVSRMFQRQFCFH